MTRWLPTSVKIPSCPDSWHTSKEAFVGRTLLAHYLRAFNVARAVAYWPQIVSIYRNPD